jgi:O-antigen/teichoic acid export membrane protein
VKEESLKNRIASGLIWSYAERFLVQAITIIVSIVLARILNPKDYGTVAVVIIFISICDALVAGGFGNALVQKKNTTDIDFNSICCLSLVVALVLYICLFMMAPWIADFFRDELLRPVIRVMGIKFIFSAFNSVQQAYVQKKMIFRKFFFATLGGTIFSAFLGVGLALLRVGAWALVTQHLSNAVIGTVILYLTIDWKPKFQISSGSIRNLWKVGSRVLASTMVYTLKDNIRSLIIGRKFTSTDLAYYNQGQKYPALIVSDIVESLGKVLFPVLSDKQDSRDVIKILIRRSIRISSYVLTPIIAGLFTVSDTFVSAILTDKWMPCAPYMRILCIVYITRPISTIFQKSLLAIGNSTLMLAAEIITSSLTIILLMISVFFYNSINLIAWSYVAIMIIDVTYYAFFVHKHFSYAYMEMIGDYFLPFIMSFIMGSGAYLVGMLHINVLEKLILQVLCGGSIYILLSNLFKVDSYYYIRDFAAVLLKKAGLSSRGSTDAEC